MTIKLAVMAQAAFNLMFSPVTPLENALSKVCGHSTYDWVFAYYAKFKFLPLFSFDVAIAGGVEEVNIPAHNFF